MFENFSVLSLPFPVVLRTQLLLHVVAKECLADIAVEQGDAEEIESLRFLPEGFGVHDPAALSWLV